MRAIIIAGGEARNGESWQQWQKEGDLIIGADGGAAQALAHGIVPHWVVGDMDSLCNQDRRVLEAHGSQFLVHTRAKDETDLELALTYAAERGAKEIVILGALGGRLDHTMANILLLALPSLEGRRVRIVDGDEEAILLHRGESVDLSGNPGDIVSLLPLGGRADGVSTRGLTWRLDGATLCFGFSRGVSNEMMAPSANVRVERGFLLVVHGPAPIAIDAGGIS